VPVQPPVPMDLRWFIDRGLAKSPDRRYPSVTAMLERLDRRGEALVPIQCHVTFLKRLTGEWMRLVDRHPLLITVTMAASVIAGLVGLGLALFR